MKLLLSRAYGIALASSGALTIRSTWLSALMRSLAAFRKVTVFGEGAWGMNRSRGIPHHGANHARLQLDQTLPGHQAGPTNIALQ